MFIELHVSVQLLSDEVQAFEVNDKTLSDKVKAIAYADIPLAVKQQI